MNSLALLRIEYKLDLIMHVLQWKGQMLLPEDLPQLEDLNTDFCPACGQNIVFSIDAVNEVYNRSCGCKPPAVLVTGISQVGQPIEETKPTRETEETGEPDAEEVPTPGTR